MKVNITSLCNSITTIFVFCLHFGICTLYNRITVTVVMTSTLTFHVILSHVMLVSPHIVFPGGLSPSLNSPFVFHRFFTCHARCRDRPQLGETSVGTDLSDRRAYTSTYFLFVILIDCTFIMTFHDSSWLYFRLPFRVFPLISADGFTWWWA